MCMEAACHRIPQMLYQGIPSSSCGANLVGCYSLLQVY